MNKTKIVATVGPACSSYEMLYELMKAGVNVFRLNFSHGTHESHGEIIKHIRRLNTEYGFHTAILGDLQGPKLRIGEVENNELHLLPGQQILFTNEKCVGNDDERCVSCFGQRRKS